MQKTKASLFALGVTALTVLTLFLLPYTPRLAVRTQPIQTGSLRRTLTLEAVVSRPNEQPCVALTAGLIRAVHVQKGDHVKAGQLLISLDTQAEEEALSAIAAGLYQRRQALDGFKDAALEAISLQSALELAQQESSLKSAIALKQVRAPSDGVIGGVYASVGAYAAAADVLGIVHGEGRAASAYCSASDAAELPAGARAIARDASGGIRGGATLVALSAPMADAQTARVIQQLTFLMDEAKLTLGERITLEITRDAVAEAALAPLGAVDANGCLWVVENGEVSPVAIDGGTRNAEYVSVPMELAGKRVVLSPGDYELSAGRDVKEARGR